MPKAADSVHHHDTSPRCLQEHSPSLARTEGWPLLHAVSPVMPFLEEGASPDKLPFRSMVERFEGLIYLCSSDFRIEFMNDQLIRKIGRDATGELCYQALHKRETVCPGCAGAKVFKGESIRWEVRDPKSNRWYSVVSTPVPRPGGTTSQQTIIEDITERKVLEERITHQAYHDILTGLPNRMLFMEHLNRALLQARREESRLALLFLDLDHFKYVNDTLGHTAGDLLLKETAGRLKACIREYDTVARIGGDEFVILLSRISHGEDASRIAEKILSLFRKPPMIDGREFPVTASIGISVFPDDSEYGETLMKNADIAMYHAKERGRNNFQFFDPGMNIRSIERMILENSLRRTLERGDLVVYYQPQLDTVTRRIIGSEALVRWRHPEAGLLDPLHFIPLAVETGLIIPIDEWVLRTACAQNKAWQEAGYEPVCITVNLSERQFRQPDFPEIVAHVLRDTGLDAEFLEIEISETTAMDNVENTLSLLQKLTDLGIRCSLDDFGTASSSVRFLKRSPFNSLKIDQSIIKGLTTNPDDQAVASAIIAMAHNLELTVVAEGVETEEHLSFLLFSRCDAVQGYLFSKPLPAEKFQNLLSPMRRS